MNYASHNFMKAYFCKAQREKYPVPTQLADLTLQLSMTCVHVLWFFIPLQRLGRTKMYTASFTKWLIHREVPQYASLSISHEWVGVPPDPQEKESGPIQGV
jgi:hypothetical protein